MYENGYVMMMRMVVVTTQTMAYTKALVADNKEEEEDEKKEHGFSFLFCLGFFLFSSFTFLLNYLMKLGIWAKSECGA